MNKMEYQKPLAEFVQFENEDVITTSGDEPPKPSGGDHDKHGHYAGWCGSWFFGVFWICDIPSRNTLNEDWSEDEGSSTPYSDTEVDINQWLDN